MKLFFRHIGLLSLFVLWSSSSAAQDPVPPEIIPAEALTVEVLNVYPHDSNAFTQGLLWHEGRLYESTGQRGESTLREVDLTTGEVIRSIGVHRYLHELLDRDPIRLQTSRDYFAEGLALVNGRLWQLTWTSGDGFIYDLETFERLETFHYQGQGWGLCYDGDRLYMSDSTQFLAIRDPQTFELIERLLVTVNGQPLQQQLLNELECVGDYVYANLWQTDFIAQIDKRNGAVVGLIDASGLLTEDDMLQLPGTRFDEETGEIRRSNSAVLNGIAYNPESDTFYITGKDWPKLFEVRFIPAEIPGAAAG